MTGREDLLLGFRLAVGGGRGSIVRLVLSTVGIGLAVAILLVAASLGTVRENRLQRSFDAAVVTEPIPGVAPLDYLAQNTDFRGSPIALVYLHPTGPNSPVPPGVDRIPAPGEVVVSPKVDELIAADTSGLLKPRLPGKQIGLIDHEALINPNDLVVYVGAEKFAGNAPVYAFGADTGLPRVAEQNILALLLIGLVILLAPVFVFIGTVSRLGAAERDRRLAALRLAGSSLPQLRRIAAAETLVSTLAGLLAGSALFLLLRAMAANIQVFRFGVFPHDLTPPWPLVALIVLVVPALTVATALTAQRHTIVEPLGVLREAAPARRRLWWRLLPIAAGIALLIPDAGPWTLLGQILMASGAMLLLLGIPALLPWLLERAVAGIRGGPASFQLAIRRLQTDSGTPSRVVAGLCVVIAGAIGLLSLLAGQTDFNRAHSAEERGTQVGQAIIQADGEATESAATALRALPGSAGFEAVRTIFVKSAAPDAGLLTLGVADCATVEATTGVTGCRDGDVFTVKDSHSRPFEKGQPVILSDFRSKDQSRDQNWTIPVAPRPVDLKQWGVGQYVRTQLLVTPAAIAGVDLSGASATMSVRPAAPDPDFVDRVRNAIAPLVWRASVAAYDGQRDTAEARMFADARSFLLGGSLFVLVLAGVSLLVLAQEQVRARRRALGALSATGVPVRVIVRSLLWQNGIPLLLGIVIATAIGVGIATVGQRLIWNTVYVDWGAVGFLAVAAAVVALLVTASTLPSVRSAARSENLRTE